MNSSEIDSKQKELDELKSRVEKLETEIRNSRGEARWQPEGYYGAYYATTGFMLGMFGAITSLLFNVVGSALTRQHPLRLIQVYLTFPLGERALELDGGIALTVGCCLYIGTGMVLGIPFHLLLTRFTPNANLTTRLIVASVFAIVVWIVSYYLVLSWLQPVLFNGNWIVEQIPWWVGALTHLVFGWTMAVVYPLGLYSPYRLQTERT